MQDVFGHFTTILEEDFRRLPKIPEDFSKISEDTRGIGPTIAEDVLRTL